MINLLPKHEKERIVRDFYLRFATVLFISISICILIASVLLLPAYFSLFTQKAAIEQKLVVQKNSPAPDSAEGNSIIIKEFNDRLNIIENINKNKFIVSTKIINEIILNKMPEVKITSINYSTDSISKKVIVSGIAPSREKLLLFRIALEDNVAFKKVDLPISNFVKGKNIQFSLTLIPS